MSPFENIRVATTKDAEQLLAIYRPYVEQTAITFETVAPTLEEFRKRIAVTLQTYPYFVYEEDGRIVGYTYASPFKDRSAYDRTVETTIYLCQEVRGRGLARKLYGALETCLKRQGILNLCACIALATRETPYLTDSSERFHRKMGYKRVARFHKCGYKFGLWWDMIWMEKMLGAHLPTPKPRLKFPEIKDALNETAF